MTPAAHAARSFCRHHRPSFGAQGPQIAANILLTVRAIWALLTLSVVVLAACSAGNEGLPGTSLLYPDAQLLRHVESSTAELYDPPTGDNSCPTAFTEYGTNDTPEDVTRFFESRGFEPRGQGGKFDGGYRWKGVRAGDEQAWRKVDIADGATAGSPDWKTFYAISEPACGTSG